MIQTAYEQAYKAYNVLLGEREGVDDFYDPYGQDPLLSEDYPGVSREIARMVLPVGLYTEFVFSVNLRNLFHLLKLRMDHHAQYEIRVFAEAMFALIQPRFPLACEAATDYLFHADTLSRMDIAVIKDMIAHSQGYTGLELQHGGEKTLAEHYGMSVREIKELKEKFLLAGNP